jgi:hypothetical protein
MKKLSMAALAACLILLNSCQTAGPDEAEGSFILLPQPVSASFSGSSALTVPMVDGYYSLDGTQLPPCGGLLSELSPAKSEKRAAIVFLLDSTLEVKSEGYTLEIDRRKVTIIGKDHAGLFYGFMTLHQLMEDALEQEVPLPLCRIRDFPLLSYRAIHLDVKHHLEKREYYYGLVDKLAGYKINAVIAEMEDKLAYELQPEVGSPDAMTVGEWRQISEYAMERNIEISPLIQGLGHASFILKHDAYRDLRDDPESDWAFNPLDPRTYEVQFDLYRDAMEATPYGRYLHVGGDEVHTTGRGSGRSPLELQMIWLEKVCSFAQENGRVPIFWDDMPLKHAEVYRPMFNPELSRETVDSIWAENEHKLLEFLDLFPKNCIYMRWNYSDPQAYGNDKAMAWFREHDLQVMGATAGQTRWVLMPQEESNMENIKTFALNSIHQGLDGLLLTLWDDDSPHFELYMRGLMAFAEYSWAGERRSKQEIKSAYRHREYSAHLAGEEYAFIDRLERPVAFWNNALLLDHRDRRSLRKMKNPLQEAIIDLPDPDHPGQWSERHADRLAMAEEMADACDSVSEIIDSLKPLGLRNTYRLAIYEQVCRMAGYAPGVLLELKSYDQATTDGERAEAALRLGKLPEEFHRVRQELEEVYGQTRILDKPGDYILDQDHHEHLANQSISFDWQFIAEILFLEKLTNHFQ